MANSSPFMQGIILLVTIILFVPGCVYGFAVGKYKNDKDLFADISLAFKDISSYIVLCFFCAQFTNYFAWSNLGAILAIKGAAFLQSMNFTGMPLIVGLVIVACIVNIFIGSASAKWAILAPVMVPMMMLLGYDPALTQAAYRIGDSITNPISPLFTYFPLVLGYVKRYERTPASAPSSPICFPIPSRFSSSGSASSASGSSSTSRWAPADTSICNGFRDGPSVPFFFHRKESP